VPGYSFVATSSNATTVAIQRANATVFRVTRIAVLSISQLYFASICFSFASGVRPGWILAPPVLHLRSYTDEAGKGSLGILWGLRTCDELLWAGDELPQCYVVGRSCNHLFIWSSNLGQFPVAAEQAWRDFYGAAG
jgi:hypothetical protein